MSAEHYRDDRPALLAAMPAPTHTPPCDDLAEECLISSVLVDPTGSGVAVAGQCGVKATSFYNPAHVLIWTVLEQLLKERCPVSVDMMATRLTEQGELEKVGGYPKLLQATGRLATSLELRHYAELVVNYWRRRHGLKLGAQLAEISAATEDREEFARECGKLGQRLITISQRTDTHTLADTITAVRTDMQLRAAGKEDRSKWVFTGLKTFDQRLKPLNSAREDGLTVVGGGSARARARSCGSGPSMLWTAARRWCFSTARPRPMAALSRWPASLPASTCCNRSAPCARRSRSLITNASA